jgi:hypothetical protein
MLFSIAFELQRHSEKKKHPADNSASSNSSEDEFFSSRSEIMQELRMSALLNKIYGNVSQEIKPKNIMSNDETKKQSNDARKRKCEAINHDPSDPTYITASTFVV